MAIDKKNDLEYRDTVRERLQLVLDKCEHNHKLNFSTRIKISTGNLDTWLNKKGAALPGIKALRNIASEYKVNLNWLILGEGHMYVFETEKPNRDLERQIDRLKGEVAAYEKILGKMKK